MSNDTQIADTQPENNLDVAELPRNGASTLLDKSFTAEELKKFDGTDPTKPILVAIKSAVFDVTSKADVYGPGCSYSIFAGKDGSRGLGMSSLKPEDAVADYSMLNEEETLVLNQWHEFFSARYKIVGKVMDSA